MNSQTEGNCQENRAHMVVPINFCKLVAR
jgi:hypothetical protein